MVTSIDLELGRPHETFEIILYVKSIERTYTLFDLINKYRRTVSHFPTSVSSKRGWGYKTVLSETTGLFHATQVIVRYT